MFLLFKEQNRRTKLIDKIKRSYTINIVINESILINIIQHYLKNSWNLDFSWKQQWLSGQSFEKPAYVLITTDKQRNQKKTKSHAWRLNMHWRFERNKSSSQAIQMSPCSLRASSLKASLVVTCVVAMEFLGLRNYKMPAVHHGKWQRVLKCWISIHF